MSKAVTVVVMALASVPAAVLVFIGLLFIEAGAQARKRAQRGTLERIQPSPAQREAFLGALSEAEFRVVNVGPTILPKRAAR